MSRMLLGGLREAKRIGSLLETCRKRFSSGSAALHTMVTPTYNFGRKPFGPDFGIKVPFGSDGLPVEVDWRKVPGAVLPAVNQLYCGSCYDIAALGSVASLAFIKEGVSWQLSAQHVLDGNTVTNYGCRGGWPQNVFEFIIRNGGVVRESAYPYTGVRGECRKMEALGVTIGGWINVMGTEESLKYAVAYQPVVVGIAADYSEFANYSRGLLKVPAPYGAVNHVVLLIGYGETWEGEDWRILNSWDPKTWGDNGTCLIPRNTNQILGAAGILSDACIPLEPKVVMVKTRTESCPTCFR